MPATAKDLIESYVTDVAAKLPRKQRNDVAFELRALLDEELQARAKAVGRDADAAMATELLQAFGRPGDVAARYRPTLTIVDPADGHAFLRATVIGLAIIWGVGLVMRMRQFVDSGSDFLVALGQWWTATVIPSLWWPGVLVVGFGVASWARRRWPQTPEWKPRAGYRTQSGRAAWVMGLVGILCGLCILVDPRGFMDAVFGSRMAPAAYDALTYTETFRRHQAPFLFVLVMLNLPMLLTAIVNGRYSAIMRRIDIGMSLATCAVMAWTVLDGPVFIARESDRTIKGALALLVAITLVDVGIRLYRSVRPAPDPRAGWSERAS